MMKILLLLIITVLGVNSVSGAGAAVVDVLEGKKSSAEILAGAGPGAWRDVNPAQVLVIELARGQVTVELSEKLARAHVAQIKTLVKAGYYDGLSFYRVIDGFVAQGGDVLEQRALPEGATKELTAEFDEALVKDFEGFVPLQKDGYAAKTGFIDGHPAGISDAEDAARVWLLHCTGAMAMARDIPKNTAGTEFYITLQPQRYLDRNLTVFGKVIDGMEHLQALKRQTPPVNPDEPLGETIVRMWIGDHPPAGAVLSPWQVLRTDSVLFTDYVEARRNRSEAFFYHRPDYIDICQLAIPVRQKPAGGDTQ